MDIFGFLSLMFFGIWGGSELETIQNLFKETNFKNPLRLYHKTSSLPPLGGWRKNYHILRIMKDFSAFAIYSIDRVVKCFFLVTDYFVLTNVFVTNKAKLRMINYCSGGCSPAHPLMLCSTS